MSEFYVGYLKKAPKHLGRFVCRLAVALAGLAVLVSVVLVSAQLPFPDSRFDYLRYTDHEGVLLEEPYPTLLTSAGSLLLVAPGKHGADALVSGMDLRRVRLRGSLIYRGQDRMLEVMPGTIRATGESAQAGDPADLGPVTLDGEIVDSKCYFGVMNPGSGKVHRDCAVRCISGGIPPAFIVRDAGQRLSTLLLTGAGGRKLNREVLDFVAEPIRISGQLFRAGDRLILQAEPARFRRLPARE